MFSLFQFRTHIAVSIMTVITLLAGVGWWNDQRRTEAITEATTDTGHMSQVLAQLVTHSLQSIDLILADVARLASLNSNLEAWRDKTGHTKLKAYVSGAPQIRTMIVFSADGRIAGWSRDKAVPAGIDISKRAYFIEMREAKTRELRVEGPFRNRASGIWSTGLFRAILSDDGDFLGLVYAAFHPDFVQKVYANSQIWTSGSFALLNERGVMIVRDPPLKDAIGRSFADRSPVYTSELASHVGIVKTSNGNKRIFARRRTPGYPFVVAAGRDVADALIGWRQQSRTLWVAAGLLSFLILLTGAALARERILNSRLVLRSKELNESQERYSLVERAVNDGVWDWNVLTGEDYLSPRWKSLLGFRNEELKNEVSTFFNLVHPDDTKLVRHAVEAHFTAETTYSVEARLRHKDGIYRWFLLRGEAQRDGDGRPVRMVGSISDITERKRAENAAQDSEARFSRILAIAPDAIAAIDQSQRIRIFNQGAEKVFGYSNEEVIGQPLGILLPERFRERHAGHIENFMSSTVDSRLMSERAEIYGLRKDGSEFPAEASISKLQMGDETILTVMLHDISDRKKVEAELLAAKEQAEYADRAKSEFLANMSHELRTPLNAIIGFSEMMTQKTFGPLGDHHYEEYSDGIFESGDHLLSLINDILDISKIESGRAELDETEVDIAKAVLDCCRLIEPRSVEAGLSIHSDIRKDLSKLWADERLVKQMLLNLLSNAVKFTESGGEIAISGEFAKDGRVSISVTDTGIGIAAKDIPKAMSTFGQIDGALDRKFEGTGLGLPLVKSLAELHGGGIQIESEAGTGTKVTIWFPRVRVVRVD
jgi:PAS domain S-box-containing protein